MKRLIAVAVLLLAASSARAQGNTYAVARTMNYYPNSSSGTVLLSYRYTGSTQQPPSMFSTGVTHQPRVTAKLLKNGVQISSQYSQGQGVSPSSQMNQLLSISFDLAASGCDLVSLGDGNCTVQDTPEIFCTALGHGFGSLPPFSVQFELANTTSQVEWNTRGVNGDGTVFYNAHQICPPLTPSDTPPDFPGPDIVFAANPPHTNGDPISSGYIRVQDFGWRWCPGTSVCGGFPWSWVNLPRLTYIGYIQEKNGIGGGECTMRDNGYNPDF